jgi:hypothetical protein
MKRLSLMLLSLILYWASPVSREKCSSLFNASIKTSHWLVRFKEGVACTNFDWPSGILPISLHAPINSVVIQTDLNELQLKEQLKSIQGIVRIEKGRADVTGNPIYPTGLAILEPTGPLSIHFLLETFHIQPITTLDALGWWVIEIPVAYSFEEFRTHCMSSGFFKNIHRDEAVQGFSEQTNDPMFSSSWHIQQTSDADIDASEAWNLLPASATTKSIAVIEGVGFDTLNADLSGRFIDRFNATNNTSNVYANSSNEKHGTATSGIPCAIANNSISAAGLGYNKLKVQAIRIGYNVTTAGNFTSTSVMQVAAINRAIAQSSTAAISMSISFTTFQSAMQSALNSARTQGRSNKGIPVFASSGNSGLSSWTNYPASYTGVIAVGATTSSDLRASFSNYGTRVTLSAPGSSIATTDITGNNGYSTGDNTYFSGTSAACPIAATVGALMIVLNDQLTESQVKQYLAQTCDKVGGYSYGANASNTLSTWCNELGYGRVNMLSALTQVAGSNNSLPDISLGAVTISTTTPQVNQSVTISCNQQIAPASGNTLSSTVEYRYSTDAIWSADDVIIGNDVSSLANGIGSEAETINYTIPAGTGTKYILIKADALSTITESNESNNISVVTITLPTSSTLPDVSITNAQCSAAGAVVGQTITISCVHSITAATNTVYPSLQYRLSTDAIWQSSDTYIGNDVSTFSSTILNESENITYTVPNQPGTRYILIKADAGSSITESNENNNVAVIPIVIAAAMTTDNNSTELKSFQEIQSPELQVFPNPADDIIAIKTTNFDWHKLEIATIQGQIIHQENNTQTLNHLLLNTSDFASGCYLVTLKNDDTKLTRRFMVN